LVTADHGGHNRSHGTRLDVDQRIPWFAWGAGVRRGRFARPVNTIDTAATVLSALGVALPPGMHGQPVFEAFSSALGPSGLGLIGDPLDPDNL
jgi:arylsulfatase A-like enzyme